jgi:hypothetical protein
MVVKDLSPVQFVAGILRTIPNAMLMFGWMSTASK